MLHVHFVDFTKICEKKTPKNSSKPNFTKNLKKLKKNFWLALFRKKFVNSIHVVDDYFLASKILLSDFTKIFSFWKFLCLFKGFFFEFFFCEMNKMYLQCCKCCRSVPQSFTCIFSAPLSNSLHQWTCMQAANYLHTASAKRSNVISKHHGLMLTYILHLNN